MEIRQLVEQMLATKLREFNNNADQFIKWCAEIILLTDAEQLDLVEGFRVQVRTQVQAEKDAQEANKISRENELTQAINALDALDGKIEKPVAVTEEKKK